MRNTYPLFFAVTLLCLALCACATASTSPEPRSGPATLLYAGSLATVMEDGVGPAFTEASGIEQEGEAHGSLGAAQLIRDGLREPDVFVSADPVVNREVLMGAENNQLVEWYVTFASSQLVIGYSPESALANELEAVESREVNWYDVLAGDDVRLGRGDPTIDPKGYRTLFLFELAARHYGQPGIVQLLGADDNPEQVLPEVSLLARVETGQFDAGIFYEHEAVAAGLPYITLPDAINLGDPRFAEEYAATSYLTPDGTTITGAPILFTITIPRTVQESEAAEAFASFVLSEPDLLESFGLSSVPLTITGEAGAVPASLRELVDRRAAP